MFKKTLQLILLITLALGIWGNSLVYANEDVGEAINELSDEIDSRKLEIDKLNDAIGQYQAEIEAKESESMTLEREIIIFENRIIKTGLEIEATEEEIGLATQEILLLENQIIEKEDQIKEKKVIIIEVLQEVNQYDEANYLEIILGNNSFSDFFDQLEYLETINQDLGGALDGLKVMKADLESKKVIQEDKRAYLVELEDALEDEALLLENQISAKNVLLIQTEASEAQFRVLLQELQQEQAYIENQIAGLQSKIESKLDDSDVIGDSSVLSWPAYPEYGISAYFHDPTYPFRHLFEHPGIDLPLNQGTAIKSVAPGYVAWTKTGRSYGNYVMVIHANGIATLYAHLSSFSVSADEFVSRGEIIGYSGGLPGTAGAGLSTGPHLHFETRLNGIPVNPLNYLISQ